MSGELTSGKILTKEQRSVLELATRTYEKECFYAVQKDEEAKSKQRQSAYNTVIAAAKQKYETTINGVFNL